MTRVVVTGMGAVSPIGCELEEIKKNLEDGYCAVNEITRFDTTERLVKLACEIPSLDILKYLDKKSMKRLDRVTQLALIAAMKAVDHSKIDPSTLQDNDRIATMVSSGIGGIETIESSEKLGIRRGFDRVSPFFITMSIINMVPAEIAIRFGINGHCQAPVSACASGANAIGDAFRSIRDGYHDVVIAGGSEASITELAIGGFTSMKALSTSTDKNRASIPFDKDREGFVMGEGAAILVLESLDHALERGATILGEITGYGLTCDASHITQPNLDGIWSARAMEKAIEESGIKKEVVDYINCHGTSTTLNDKCETIAIKRLFGDHAKNLVVSSTKSMTGHLLGASGALESLITLLSINNEKIYPTINYEKKDEDCDLDICPNKARDKQIEYALSNSLGFGGHNVSLMFKRWNNETEF